MDINTISSSEFHERFDANAKAILEPARDTLLECGLATGRTEEIIAQVLMNFLGGADWPHHDTDQVHDATSGHFTADQKAAMVRIADHLGPDWAQALYHAAVFITKVA